MSYLFSNIIKNSDAFGRERVSEPLTLGDYNHIYGENKSFLSIVNGGSITYDVNKCAAILTTSSGNTDSVIHQSKLYHRYMPGKSQLIFLSFLFNSPIDNVIKRIGYFDDRDGVFFEQNGGVLNFVVRDWVTGSQNNTTISQSNWNKDKCDGTGRSKFNLDITKTQLAFFDFQWLGVGRIRMGFVHDGELIIAHEEYHSNNLATVYWSNPALPVRGEIINTGPTSGGTMDFICATVLSEGGYDISSIELSTSSDVRTIATASFTLPSVAIRLKNLVSGKPNRIDVKPGPIDILAENNNLKYELWRLPGGSNITGGTWVSAGDDSGIEYNVTATGWTSSGGDLIISGFAAASTSGASNKNPQDTAVLTTSTSKKGFISQNYDSTDSEIFVVVITALTVAGGGCSFRTSLQWKENS